MKPVNKGAAPKRYSAYAEAKPDLVEKLGPFCSYCEAHGNPTALDVEHIYPQKAHPTRERQWGNFLLSCKSCNSKKNAHLGSGRQRNLHARFLWPHLDNTARAFEYTANGIVRPANGLSPQNLRLATETIAMVGFMSSPAAAADYETRSTPYTGASIREDIWHQAESIKKNYIANPSTEFAGTLANLAASIGYFSVWMEVFRDRPEFRHELVRAFRADPACFDPTSQPVARGRT
jgi:uncharacterized protein (TIGR02646 family)